MSEVLTQDEREHKVKLLIEEPVAMAKQRLMDFAASLPSTSFDDDGNEVDAGEVTYTELMERAKDYLDRGEYWSEGGRFESQGIYGTFWEDYELVTGTTVAPDNKYGFFSCSC